MLGNVHNRRGTAVGADPQCTVLTHTPGAAGRNRTPLRVLRSETCHIPPVPIPPQLLGLILLRLVVTRDGIGYQVVADEGVVDAAASLKIFGSHHELLVHKLPALDVLEGGRSDDGGDAHHRLLACSRVQAHGVALPSARRAKRVLRELPRQSGRRAADAKAVRAKLSRVEA